MPAQEAAEKWLSQKRKAAKATNIRRLVNYHIKEYVIEEGSEDEAILLSRRARLSIKGFCNITLTFNRCLKKCCSIDCQRK